ncbi:Ig-like domain-containing protein [Priestia aryabhattai]|uniref:Ig-like domain-containing protein n=1 Tax=Priestia aryabhattai TaxID=412384 RepID=UPI001C8D59C1|nr:Ig-like domain-containing protein [Priestia aryabhattai]MBX9988121.1 Ig-like domain-containing protein [Priestia aryabhattai]MBY0001514.1 Ig-like domain-containing protein [Priestia aryabhattai]
MRKWLLALFIFVLLIIGYLGFQHGFRNSAPADNKVANAEDKKNVEKKQKAKDTEKAVQGIELDKTWNYSFDKEIDPDSLTDETVSITDNNGKKVSAKVSLQQLDKTIHIEPPAGGYKKGTIYHLTMTKGIAYKDGSHVSKPYKLTFVTKRDKVVDGKLNPAMTKVSKEDIKSFDGETLKLDKSVKDNLQAGDILILPSDEFKEGKAVKVTSVDTHLLSYEAKVGTPHFNELFEKLDVYGSFPIKAENVHVVDGVKGVTVQSIAQSTPNTMVASSNSTEKHGEFFAPDFKATYSKQNGFQLTMDNIKFGEGMSEFAIDGAVQVFDPVVDIDTDIEMYKTNRLIYTNHIVEETRANVQLAGNKGKFKGFKKTNEVIDEVVNEKLKLADFTVPIPEFPVVEVKGILSLKLETTISGQIKATLVTEVDDTRGIIFDGIKTRPFEHPTAHSTIGIQGNGGADFKVGPNVQFGFYGVGVFGAGAETFGAYKAKAEAAVGSLSSVGKYFCYNVSAGPSVTASLFVDIENPLKKENSTQRLAEWTFLDTNVGKKYAKNTCNTFNALVVKGSSIQMKAGSTKELPILGEYTNLQSSSVSKKNISNMKDIEVSLSAGDTVKVHKDKNSNVLTIEADKFPKHKDTNLILTYKEKSEATGKTIKSTLKIPITISNYKEVQESVSANLNGDWTRNIQNAVGNLKISKANGKSFYFTLETLGGGYTGGMEGTANVNGSKAVFKDTEMDSNCVINFDLKKNTIELTENEGCAMWHGALAGFDGTYDKGTENVKTKSLSDSGIVTPQDDKAIKQLVGSEYKTLSEDLMQWDESDDPNMEGAKVISGGVPQMYSFREAIIIIKDSYYYVAFTKDDNKILYYSNDPTYASMFPGTIEDWSFKFENFSIKMMSKNLAN